MTFLPQATSWLLSEASFVLEGEEEGTPDARGESPQGFGGRGGRGGGRQSSDSGDEPRVDEYKAFLTQFLVLSPKRRKGDA